jgi:signal transduction histidine kinase
MGGYSWKKMMNEDNPSTKNTDPGSQQQGKPFSIRSQLIWASLFPLAIFSVLSAMLISYVINQIQLDSAYSETLAQVRWMVLDLLVNESDPGNWDSQLLINELSLLASDAHAVLAVVDEQYRVTAASDPGLVDLNQFSSSISRENETFSLDMAAYPDRMIGAISPIRQSSYELILLKPWSEINHPVIPYLLTIIALLCLSVLFSMYMLSLSTSRIIKPIHVLVENAVNAVPGSVFHPIEISGPMEIRQLITAFNQMVIRLAEQQAAVRQYSHKALLSQEEERQRLSHELHDVTLQDLISLIQRVELCQNEVENDPKQARQRLAELHSLIEKSIEDIRHISSALRPPILEDLGLSIAINALCEDLEQEMGDIVCEYTISGEPKRLSPDLELAVYRVVQEALANIRKHARNTTRVSISLAFESNAVAAKVVNNGGKMISHDIRALVRAGHLGLAGMVERARLFGGSLDISSNADRDTIITLRLPIPIENI